MAFLVAISILLLLALLIQNRIKPPVLFFGLLLVYYVFDLIDLDVMLKNFVNKSLVTLLLLMLISVVIEKTSFMRTVSEKIFNKSFSKSLFKLTLFTSFFSAFLNNTAVVASMISVVKQNKHHPMTKLLIPLSYAAIFGGTVTLIGTSTNLIVNSFMLERGLKGFELFDFMYVGVPIALIGSFVVYGISRFLPSEKKVFIPENYFIEAKVSSGSKLIGKSIKENGLRNLEYLFLSEIFRNETALSPVNPNEIIQDGDVLIFSGDVKEIKILKQFDGLELGHTTHDLSKNLTEAIVSHESNLIGKQIKKSNFRTKFDATVVAIKRGDEKLSGKIGEIELQAGDSLVLTTGSDFYQRDNLKKNFYFTNSINITEKLTKAQSLFALASFATVILLSLFKLLSLIKGLFILLALFVVLKFIDFNEIKRRFPYELALIIGSALGISAVMINTGLANNIASGLQYLFGGFGIYGAFISIYLLTLLLTEIITNNAAAALSFPIGYSTAIALDVSVLPFVMAVAYGASASFMTPYGYQTNLMVASVGGYSFKTFIKSGFFVSLVYSLLAIILIPIFFPF